MSMRLGALWNNNSDNPRAPVFYGSLEIKDRESAIRISEQLVRGERVRVSVFKGKGEMNGKKYPDYEIVLDDYSAVKSDNVPF